MKLLFTGGVAILETKVSEYDGLWHVHLHIITEGQFVDQRELSRAWHEITGDSSIVDVRAVRDHAKSIAYICKYVSKPIDASLYGNDRALDEYILAISGRKTLATFGTWRGLKLKERQVDDTQWIRYMSLLEFADACRRRDVDALRVLALLRPGQEPESPAPREPGSDDDDSP
jgi:hypothetical protein